MKHYHLIVILWALLMSVPTQADTHSLISPTLSPPVDKHTEIKANLRQAKYMMEHGNYLGAKPKLERVLILDPDNQEAQKLLATCNKNIEEQLKVEREAYQKACDRGTAEAFSSFVTSYPNSKYKKDAEERIAEFKLWSEARSENAKESYQRYLSESSLKLYEKEAEQRISVFFIEEQKKAIEDDWNHCDIKSRENLLLFLQKYPQSKYANWAKYHLNIMDGVDAYKEGDRNMAFQYLQEAKREAPLDDDALRIYDELYREKTLMSTDINEIKQYMNTLSSKDPYIVLISNHLATLLAYRFNEHTTEQDVEEAYRYAKDESTKRIVYNSAAMVKKEISSSSDLYSWWKERLLFGVKVDAEKNVYEPSWAFDGGIVFKMGKHTDLFNLSVGVDFRFYVFNKFPKKKALADVAQDAYITGGQIVIPITARFNIYHMSETWVMYVGGACNIHNRIHDSFNIQKPHSVSFEPQVGVVSRHWDVGIHFKKFAKTPYFIDCRSNYIGIHGVYYF